MALRLVAEHVDRDLRDIMSEQKIAGPWKSGDRLLVAVSASPYSERLIRYTRRLAASMEASWIVANIERPRPLSQEEQTRLTRYLALARQLGAEVVSTPGRDVGEALLRIARQHNVTQIVIGKPLGSRWAGFWKRDPLRWLMSHSGNIDIHMIPSDESAPATARSDRGTLARAPWRDFGIALAHRGGRDGASPRHFRFTGYWAVALFYLLAVVLAATRLAALANAFSRRPQRVALGFSLHSAAIHFLHHASARLHDVRRVFRHRARHRPSRHPIARTRTIRTPPGRARDRALSFDARARREPRSRRSLAESLVTDQGFFSRRGRRLAARSKADFPSIPPALSSRSSKDESVAMWAFQKKQARANPPIRCRMRKRLHLPLVTGDRAEGVLTVRLAQPPTLEQRELLDAFAVQLALFVNKERALEESRAAQLARNRRKLQKTFSIPFRTN